jgi:DNA (cytosine-5)-methyltransferase 1
MLPSAVMLLPTPTATDMTGSFQYPAGNPTLLGSVRDAGQWGQYAPAIARWEQVLGRPAPDPTESGTRGQPRLSPRFVEWMQGLPEGWVTAVPGLSRNDQLRILGNGVVPVQAAHTLAILQGRLP